MFNKDWYPIFAGVLSGILCGVIVGIILLIAMEAFAYGPKTEAIIPIGKSPGLSGVCTSVGKLSWIGEIEELTVALIGDGAGNYLGFEPIAPSEVLPYGLAFEGIWLNGKSLEGGIQDIHLGVDIEVKGTECCLLYFEKYPDSIEPCKMWIKLEERG